MKVTLLLSILLSLTLLSQVHAQPPASDGSTGSSVTDQQAKAAQSLKKKAQTLKSDILSLSKDLEELETALLYPSDVQFGVFLSLAENTKFALDSIEIYVDDALVSTHLYQTDDIRALRLGGVQQLYRGSVAPGQHKLAASFNGKSRTGGYFKRKKSLRFDKSNAARYIQLVVSESPTTGEPLFKVKQW